MDKCINKKDYFFYIGFFLIAILCLYVKARYGICEDEEFFVSIIYRIAKNPSNTLIFKIWDSYQLSGTLFSPFVILYKSIFNSYDYLYLFLRLIAIVLLLCVSLYIYFFCYKEIKTSKKIAFIISFIYLLSVPKLAYNVDNSLQLMIYYSIFSCELYKFIKNRKIQNLIISAVFYCFSILAYITVVFSLPIVLAIMIYYLKKDNNEVVKNVSIFVLTCFILCVIFLGIF